MEQKTGTIELEVIKKEDAAELFTCILLQTIERGRMNGVWYGIEDAEGNDGTRYVIARLDDDRKVKIAITNFE